MSVLSDPEGPSTAGLPRRIRLAAGLPSTTLGPEDPPLAGTDFLPLR